MRTCGLSRIRNAMVPTIVLTLTIGVFVSAGGRWDYKPSKAEQRALASITPLVLQAHLSFLSADALDGRGSGSRGLDVAAEYIAAQFRRAGLKPIGDDGYFQTTPRTKLVPNPSGYACRLSVDGRILDVAPRQFAVVTSLAGGGAAIRAVQFDDVAVFKVPFGGPVPEQVPDAARTAIVTEVPAMPADPAVRASLLPRINEFSSKLRGLNAALVVDVRRDAGRATDYFAASQLVDPDAKGRPSSGSAIVALFGDSAGAFYDTLPDGATSARLTVRLAAPLETNAPQRNVIGLLPGSDPKLRDTYVLLTAHYDGQGTRSAPDPIWNSANDNGSGTVAVIELAAALASLPKHPRRSIVFMAFHGEESGLVGSRYYAAHPIVPLDKSIANLNLEMVGRTDDTEGDQRKRASITGFDFTEIGDLFRRAGVLTGMTVFKHPKNSDAYFGSSDNAALANLGVPAHTLCVTYQYPDYHGAADTWQKVDYENMALTVRMIGTGVLMLAQSADEPRWNANIKPATRYLEAWKKLHPAGR